MEYKYYKKQVDCPYEHGTKEGLFWYLEKQFDNNLRRPDFLGEWLGEVDSYLERNAGAKNDLTDPEKYTKEQKALILFMDAMIDKWSPSTREWIFDY